MKLKFVQYTSPQKRPGGFQWVEKSGIGVPLDKFNSYLKQIDWSPWDSVFRAGICLLPADDIGIVFKIIKSCLPAYDGRRGKDTTNGVVFSLSDAKKFGIDGIEKLPLFDDPAEEGRQLEIDFLPDPSDGNLTDVQKSIDSGEEAFFRISKGSDGALKADKILSSSKSESIEFSNHKPSSVESNNRKPERGHKDIEKFYNRGAAWDAKTQIQLLINSQLSGSITVSKKKFWLYLTIALLLGVGVGKVIFDKTPVEIVGRYPQKSVCDNCKIELMETESSETDKEGEQVDD